MAERVSFLQPITFTYEAFGPFFEEFAVLDLQKVSTAVMMSSQ